MTNHERRARATVELITRAAREGRLEPVMRPLQCASLLGISVQDVHDAIPHLQAAGVIALRCDEVIELAVRPPAERQLTIGD